MPYIKKQDRENLEVASNAGELNYLITRDINECLKRKGESYSLYDEIIDILVRYEQASFEDIMKDHVGGRINSLERSIRRNILAASINKVSSHKGTLRALSYELYRRKTAPYEDLKIKDNGDVYI